MHAAALGLSREKLSSKVIMKAAVNLACFGRQGNSCGVEIDIDGKAFVVL